MPDLIKLEKNLVESKEFPGYYHLKDFPLYVLREDGDLIYTVTKHHIKKSLSPTGYQLYHSILDSYGKKRTVLVSRLLKMTFDPVEGMENLHVDHINNNKTDNRLCNLNWVTNQENIAKAGKDGLLARHRPILLRNYRTGEVMEFPSLNAVARFLNIPAENVRYRVKCNDSRVFPEGYQFKYKDDVMDWNEFEEYKIEEALIRYGHERKVMLRNLITGEVFHFDTMKDAAESISMPTSTLSNYINKSSDLQPVLPGLIQLKYENDLREWIDYDDPYLELAKLTGERLIQVTNADTLECRLYLNQLDCCRDMNIKPSALNNRLKMYEPGHVFKDGYMVEYYPGVNSHMTKAQRSSVWSRAKRLPETPST